MIGVFAFPALLPSFLVEWSLTNTQAGWISGVYFAAYAVTVPVLVGITDRVDAKRVFMLGALVAGLSAGGFALFAEGFWTAMLFRGLGGVGLAGSYMPGLKALVDRIPSHRQARAIPLYTASFSLGTALSFLAVGKLAEGFGWRAAFMVAAGGGLLGCLIAGFLKPVAPHPPATPTRLLDFRPVLRNRRAMGYVLGYAVHCWELFGLRSWQVAFLTFIQAGAAVSTGLSPTAVGTWSGLVAVAASLGGAGLATRFGRPRVIALFMAGSAAAAFLTPHAGNLPYEAAALAVIAWGALIQLDSAALTTGAVQAAEPGRQGATMAMHSLLGFSAAFLGPLAIGVVLDQAGGGASLAAWALAFGSVGAVALLGPLAIRLAR
ncbi:MAG: MFS transporter [Alphaproteobacteria bacterium]|nr:MFS transporter [Alphaproteobacteria bacterium]